MALSEFAGVDFGDKRLDKRGAKILHSLAQKPSLSLNNSFNGWAESKGGYRFFANDKVTPSKILQPHKNATINRIAAQDTILCIQDTTIIDYSHRLGEVDGLGKLRREAEQGFLLHPTIAFSDTGLCLGVIHNKAWIRERLLGQKLREVSKPVEEKESIRWIESYREMQKIAKDYPDKAFINIADREGDFYEFLKLYNAQDAKNAHLLVRAKAGRVIKTEDGMHQKLWAELAGQESQCQVTFEISSIRRHKSKEKLRTQRIVTQDVKAQLITLSAPTGKKHYTSKEDVKLMAILCSETNAPSEDEKIEWLLLTTERDLSKVKEIISYYVLRWQIEIFFKVLKSGCKIEELQLESRDRLEKCISMYMIVAWRLLFLSYIGRNCPDLPCDLFYDTTEWKAIYIIYFREKPPEIPPSINKINRIIASFGGFLNRKSDKEPGIKTMWIGLQRLRDFAISYEIFSQPNICG